MNAVGAISGSKMGRDIIQTIAIVGTVGALVVE
jgi:hypothetical protein